MASEDAMMDTEADDTTKVKVFKCYFCSKYIAAESQVLYTHVQLHVEYMGRDADQRYRCPIVTCPAQRPTPRDLTTHLMEDHANFRRAKQTSTMYQKAIQFGIRTRERLIKMTDEAELGQENILKPRPRRPVHLDNRGPNYRGVDNGPQHRANRVAPAGAPLRNMMN